MEKGSQTVDMPSASAVAPAFDDEPPLLPGLHLGSYRIVCMLGEGGMGRVYLAEHTVIKRRVALKVLRRALVDSQRAVERFFAEAEAVNRIHHPAIVEVTDLFVADGTPCIVMEVLEGHTLADEIAGGALPPARVIAIGREVAAALAATHAAGVVHRDLKPDNIFLVDRSGLPSQVKILDFGVAKLADAMPAASSGKTAAGSILGTPEYMAPEQLAGKAVDERVDIYALGVTLYHACAGRVPFTGGSFGDLVVKHMTQPPPPLATKHVPPGLERAIFAMMQKEPQDRPSSMSDVDDLLLAAPTWRPPTRKPLLAALALAGAACVAVGVAWSMGGFGQSEGRGDDRVAIAPASVAPASVAVPTSVAPLAVAAAALVVDVATVVPPVRAKKLAPKAVVATQAPAPPPEPLPVAPIAPPVEVTPVKPAKPTKRAVLDPFAEGG